MDAVGDAIAAASKWITETAGLKSAKAPEAALEPLYSAWYSFHQNVSDKGIEAESAAERIVAVYNDLCVADCGAADKPVYVLNATGKAGLTLRLAAPCAKAEVYDTFGNLVATRTLPAGLQSVSVPASGYVKLAR